MNRLMLAAVSMALVACSGSPSMMVCVPGETQLCNGPGACVGAQTCNSGGTAFESCQCGSGGGAGGGSATAGGSGGSATGGGSTAGGAGGSTGGGAVAGGAGGSTGGGSGGGTAQAPGNITFLWQFASQGCTAAGVDNVRITIPGQTLMNNGVYPCETAGTAGIVLNNFSGGTYNYTIEGRTAANEVHYVTASQLIVNGNVTVQANLPYAPHAFIQWTFPPNSQSSNPTCAQAGVATVAVRIDNGATTQVTCSIGQTGSGFRVLPLSAGAHSVTLSGVDSQGFEYYSKASSINAAVGGPVNPIAFDWAVGGATIHWSVTRNGVTQSSCAAEGITTVYVNFRDNLGNLVYTSPGDPQPCASLAVVYSFLKPGTYAVFLAANGTAGPFESSTTAPAMVTVVAGVFTNMSQGPTLLLNR